MATVNPTLNTPTSRKLSKLDCDNEMDRRDSGYYTRFQTPSSKSSRSSSHISGTDDGSRAVSHARLLPNLQEFDKDVDSSTILRFNQIQSQIEKPLLQYVQKKSRKYRSMAVRLMILGKSAEEAKPHIVVLASEDQCKYVRKFFDKSTIKALCHPDDITLPSFEVFVYGRPPDPKNAEDISVLMPFVDGELGYMSGTFCGEPIIIRHPSGTERRATFGGVIKAIDQTGEFKLYGFTAGHVIMEAADDHDVTFDECTDGSASSGDLLFSDSEGEESEEESDEADEFGEVKDEASIPETAAEDHQLAEQFEKALALKDDGSASWSTLEVRDLGVIAKASPQLQNVPAASSAFYDWALIEMIHHKPNRLRPRRSTTANEAQVIGSSSGELILPSRPSPGHTRNRSVVIMSGSEGPKRATLSCLPSRLLLRPGKELIDAWIVKPNDSKEIVDGDSGSWVVNEKTLEVYGHIVAADDFGGGYMIPIHDTLRDMKAFLGVQSVELATTVDMVSIVLGRIPEGHLGLGIERPELPPPMAEQIDEIERLFGRSSFSRYTSSFDSRDDMGPRRHRRIRSRSMDSETIHPEGEEIEDDARIVERLRIVREQRRRERYEEEIHERSPEYYGIRWEREREAYGRELGEVRVRDRSNYPRRRRSRQTIWDDGQEVYTSVGVPQRFREKDDERGSSDSGYGTARTSPAYSTWTSTRHSHRSSANSSSKW